MTPLLHALHRFAHDVLAEIRALARPVFVLDIVHDDERSLVLRTRRREIAVDRRYGTVKTGSRVLARFADVKCIELRGLRDRSGESVVWSVSLRLGWFRHIGIGMSHDDVHASIVAARLSTLTGRPVRVHAH